MKARHWAVLDRRTSEPRVACGGGGERPLLANNLADVTCRSCRGIHAVKETNANLA